MRHTQQLRDALPVVGLWASIDSSVTAEAAAAAGADYVVVDQQHGVIDPTTIDAAALTEVAADKALKSQKPRALEPGNYTVILEPRPAARFLSLMMNIFNARAAEEGRSFMS